MSKYTKFSQQVRRKKAKGKMEKYKKQMQSRKKKYMTPPPQVQFNVTHRKIGDEAANFMQMQEEARRLLMLVESVQTKLVHSHWDEAVVKLQRCRRSTNNAILWTAI